MNRRNFLHTSLLAALPSPLHAAGTRPRRILLYNGWQTENIGDVAHAPGILALLEKHLPEAEITLWPHYHHLPPEEVAMLTRRFPKLRIVAGQLDAGGRAARRDRGGDGRGRLLPPRVGAGDDRVAADRGVPQADGPGLRRVRRHLRALRDAGEGAAQRRGVPLLPRLGVAGAGQAGRRSGRRSWSSARTRSSRSTSATMPAPRRISEGRGWRRGDSSSACRSSASRRPGCTGRRRRPFDEPKHARNEAMKEHDHAPLREAITSITRADGDEGAHRPRGRDRVADRHRRSRGRRPKKSSRAPSCVECKER